jgi:hypothetical protein
MDVAAKTKTKQSYHFSCTSAGQLQWKAGPMFSWNQATATYLMILTFEKLNERKIADSTFTPPNNGKN